jgi:glycosyltransferase involved in cell wall biosynthesis
MMSATVLYDGLNLALGNGTGIATYTRSLIKVARRLGYRTGVVHGTRGPIPKDPVLREIALFDETGGRDPYGKIARRWVKRRFAAPFGRKVTRISLTGTVLLKSFEYRLDTTDSIFASEDLFGIARAHFKLYGTRLPLSFDHSPALLHCTYPLPMKARGAASVYTIHDLVPLRLPHLSEDNKRYHYRLLKRLVRSADHIVTVSETSRRDIIRVLRADERRVTNTYQAIDIPEKLRSKAVDVAAAEIAGIYNLDWQKYFLFLGALEPKKNIMRLAEAYLAAKTDMPLVIVGAPGWKNQDEQAFVDDPRFGFHLKAQDRIFYKRRIQRFHYVPYPLLVSLIRGARAVLFPSLYEGFGLPVLEAMQLGTPVMGSTEGSVPEVAGEAALLVDPYDTTALRNAIIALASDEALCKHLSRAGSRQAGKFSSEAYQERIDALYSSILR